MIINEVKHFWVYWPFGLFLGEVPIHAFCPFLSIGFSHFLLIRISSLHVMDMTLYLLVNIFSHSASW